jgi:hypothetical protein
MKLDKNNKLLKSVAYLAGPIENCINSGINWRKSLVEKLNGLGIISLDPTNKMWTDDNDIKQETRGVASLKESGQFTELKQKIKKIRRIDLRCVDIADFIIAYIDPDIYTCGSFDEIFTAEREQKPILVLAPKGIKSLPSWLFGAIQINEVFTTEFELIKYLKFINDDKLEMDDRWVLMRDYIFNQTLELIRE